MTNNVWLKGHTGTQSAAFRAKHSFLTSQDFGSITVVWSQPISALQILSSDGKWRWIKHIDNALVGASFQAVVLFSLVLADHQRWRLSRVSFWRIL